MSRRRKHQRDDLGEPAGAKRGSDRRTANGRAENLIREIADEARHIGQRLARLAALARVGRPPAPDGWTIDDLSVTADRLQVWSDQLSGHTTGHCQPEG